MDWLHNPENRPAKDPEYLARAGELQRRIARQFAQQRAAREPLAEKESLRVVRKRRGLTQATVAMRLDASQSDVSRMERRTDLRVGTLSAYIEALGGSLDLVARFPGLHIRLTLEPPPRITFPQ